MEPAAWQFIAVAAACFVTVGLSLWRGKTLGMAWRGRFIAHRDREPRLFGCSVAMFAAFGAFLVYVVIITR
jgi:hypothetical protein